MILWWLASALTSWVFCRFAGKILKKYGVVDRPNQRSSHTIPTVRGGGVGMVLCWPILTLVGYGLGFEPDKLSGILVLAMGLSLVSFIDDIRPLAASLRFIVHSVVTVGGLFLLGMEEINCFLLILSFLFVVGYTNAFNFMDGVDGLAAGQAVIAGLGTAVIAIAVDGHPESSTVLISIIMSGSAFGFLPHNFPRARMFMGDVSSASIGFLSAMLAVELIQRHSLALAVPLLILHANFILDTGITLLKRIVRGENIKSAHRSHYYQLLVRSGWSHPKVTSLEIGVQALIVVAVIRNLRTEFISWNVFGLLVVLLWCSIFSYIHRVFNERLCTMR